MNFRAVLLVVCHILIYSITVFSTSFITSYTEGDEFDCDDIEDYSPLVSLYNSTNGDHWNNNNGWLEDCNICNWNGVFCHEDGRVMGIILFDNGLSNVLPPEIGNLSKLEFLILDQNELTGSIPDEIWLLPELKYLMLNNNSFTGELSGSMASLLNAEWIYLNDNDLSGEIPNQIGNLTKLTQLSLSNNRLSGEIPKELAFLSEISNMYLNDNELEGCIPQELKVLCGRDINIFGNSCLSDGGDFLSFCGGSECAIPKVQGCGTCSDGIHNQDEVEIDCGGSCETCLPCSDSIQYSALMDIYNTMNGVKWSNREGWGESCHYCDWYGVQCDGGGNVSDLILANNNLQNSIPPSIGAMSELRSLILDENEIRGHLPKEIGNLVNLEFLTLSYNEITGSIPEEIGNLSNLKWLFLNDNNLSDNIPSSFSGLSSLRQLLLNNNQFTGSIPFSIGTLEEMTKLYLDHNDLSGCIPASFVIFCDLEVRLNDNPCLSQNGDFESFCNDPTCPEGDEYGCESCEDGIMNQNEVEIDCGGLCSPCSDCPDQKDYETLMDLYRHTDGDNWTINVGWGEECDVCDWYGVNCDSSGRVTALFLVNNGLKNSLPTSIGNLDRLNALLLDNNALTGSLPTEISKLADLEYLILNNNQFSGLLPRQYGALTNLKWLLLQNNQLEGAIPSQYSNMKSLQQMYLNSNFLSDTIPGALSGLTSITNLYLNDNQLEGCIPSSFVGLCGRDINLENNSCLSQSGSFSDFCLSGDCQIPKIAGCGTCDDGIWNQDEVKVDCGGTCAPCTQCPDVESYEPLMALYRATDGENWINQEGWGTNCDVCDWYGVQCDSLGSVTTLFLPANGLQFSLPPAIGELSELSTLILDKNNLNGPIPTEIGRLSKLQYLILNDNKISGTIPEEIGDLTKLTWLLLQNNLLLGEIPENLGSLKNLKQMYLGSNLLSGTIPETLTGLTAISNLYLNDNNLSGCIPAGFLNLCSKDIQLDNNQCLSHGGSFRDFCADQECNIPALVGCGTCEDGIQNQDETAIDCGGEACTPCAQCPEVKDYEALMTIYNSTGGDNWNINDGWAQDCQICNWYGVVCDSSGRVETLFLIDNNLTGKLPAEIGLLTKVKALLLDNNELVDTIPNEIGNLQNLEYLTLNENSLSGKIPEGIGSLQKLKWLLLNNNLLHGEIPGSLGNLFSISQLLLHSNNLTGEIPNSLIGLSQLKNLYLNDNNISGCIPIEFSQFCGLDVRLQNNQCLSHNGDFTAFCAAPNCSIPKISGCGTCTDGILNQDEEGIDCGGTCEPCAPCIDVPDYAPLMALYNSTDGNNWINKRGWGLDCDVCTWFGIECDSSSRVINVFLVNNGLNGILPPEIGDLKYLNALLLDFNKLQGPIPEEVVKLKNLEYLIASSNFLSGEIPEELGQISNLKWLLLDYNELEGQIPPSLGNLSEINQLVLTANNFSGPIPVELGLLSTARNIYLDQNNLSGCIPEEMKSLCGKSIRLQDNPCLSHNGSFNAFCDDVPCNEMEVCQCASPSIERNALMTLYHSTKGENWVSSEGWMSDCDICDWYGVVCDDEDKVRDLVLSKNNLDGQIPGEIADFKDLEYLDLSDNRLTESIPRTIGNLKNLSFLRLDNNLLSDTLPDEIGDLESLWYLRINNNNLLGKIPSEIGKLSNLFYVNLSRNKLSGPIPDEIADITNLFQLYLQDNELSGCIPEVFESMCSKKVDLSGNTCLSHNGNFENFCTDSVCDLLVQDSCLQLGAKSIHIEKRITTEVVNQKSFEIDNVQIQIFPNPTFGIIQIESIEANEVAEIQIFNNLGQTVLFQENVLLPAQLNLTEHSNGLYMILIKRKDEFFTRMILKQ